MAGGLLGEELDFLVALHPEASSVFSSSSSPSPRSVNAGAENGNATAGDGNLVKKNEFAVVVSLPYTSRAGVQAVLEMAIDQDYPASAPRLKVSGLESASQEEMLQSILVKNLPGPNEPCLLLLVDAFRDALDSNGALSYTCQICFEAIPSSEELFRGSLCGHAFHNACFHGWRLSSIERKTSSSEADESRARRKQRESAAVNEVKLAEQAIVAIDTELTHSKNREVLLKRRKELISTPSSPASNSAAGANAVTNKAAKAVAVAPNANKRFDLDEALDDVAEIDRRLAQLAIDHKANLKAKDLARTRLQAASAALEKAKETIEIQAKEQNLAMAQVPCPICRRET